MPLRRRSHTLAHIITITTTSPAAAATVSIGPAGFDYCFDIASRDFYRATLGTWMRALYPRRAFCPYTYLESRIIKVNRAFLFSCVLYLPADKGACPPPPLPAESSYVLGKLEPRIERRARDRYRAPGDIKRYITRLVSREKSLLR